MFWAPGLLFWLITYVFAPRASMKSGRYISGAPGLPFLLFLTAGLISPCKWLMLAALADYKILLLLGDLLDYSLSAGKESAGGSKADNKDAPESETP